MGSSRPATGCTAVNTDSGLGCTSKGKTIAKKMFSLAVVFFVYLCDSKPERQLEILKDVILEIKGDQYARHI